MCVSNREKVTANLTKNQDVIEEIREKRAQERIMRTITTVLIKADLQGTTLSHTTSLRQAYGMNCSCKSNLQLVYDGRVGPKSCRRSVVSLLYATKSYHVNRPLRIQQIITYLVIFFFFATYLLKNV